MSLKSYRIKNINDPYFKEMWELFTSSFPSVEIRSYEDTEKALTKWVSKLTNQTKHEGNIATDKKKKSLEDNRDPCIDSNLNVT